MLTKSSLIKIHTQICNVALIKQIIFRRNVNCISNKIFEMLFKKEKFIFENNCKVEDGALFSI